MVHPPEDSMPDPAEPTLAEELAAQLLSSDGKGLTQQLQWQLLAAELGYLTPTPLLEMQLRLRAGWTVADLAAAKAAERDAGAGQAMQLGPLERLPRPVPVLDAPGPRYVGGRAQLASAGEYAVLAGEGNLGKSYLALELALLSDAARRAGLEPGRCVEGSAGLGVSAGRVLYATWEDSPAQLGARAEAVRRALAGGWVVAPPERSGQWEYRPPLGGDGELSKALAATSEATVWVAGGPLWAGTGRADAPPQPTREYALLLAEAERGEATLVVVDPVSSAYAASANDAAYVRGFTTRLGRDLGRLGCACLLLGHAAKANRGVGAAARGNAAVAGSHQWADGARGVLSLAPPAEAGGGKRGQAAEDEGYGQTHRRELAVVKSSYGPAGWEGWVHQRRLESQTGRFAGWTGWAPETAWEDF